MVWWVACVPVKGSPLSFASIAEFCQHAEFCQLFCVPPAPFRAGKGPLHCGRIQMPCFQCSVRCVMRVERFGWEGRRRGRAGCWGIPFNYGEQCATDTCCVLMQMPVVVLQQL